MKRRDSVTLRGLALAVAACGGEPREPAAPTVTATRRPLEVDSPVPIRDAAALEAGVEPGAAPDASGAFAVSARLHADHPPCVLAWTASNTEDHEDWFLAAGIERIETREGGGCAAGVLYDVATETKAAPDDLDPEPLAGGLFPKPGRPPHEDVDNSWCHFEDLSFDGFADLCVVRATGAYNYSQVCFVFDPAARRFVRNADLGDLIFMNVDAKRRRLSSGYRIGGPSYFRGEYGWENGELVTLQSESTTLGERPDGKPLPRGFSSWVVRHERKGGRLVKTFDGPRRGK